MRFALPECWAAITLREHRWSVLKTIGIGWKNSAVKANADAFHVQVELLLDGEDGAPLGGAVQLGQDDAGAVDDLLEHLGLGDVVLAAGGVEHKKDLVRGALDALAEDAVDFLQLAHEV